MRWASALLLFVLSRDAFASAEKFWCDVFKDYQAIHPKDNPSAHADPTLHIRRAVETFPKFFRPPNYRDIHGLYLKHNKGAGPVQLELFTNDGQPLPPYPHQATPATRADLAAAIIQAEATAKGMRYGDVPRFALPDFQPGPQHIEAQNKAAHEWAQQMIKDHKRLATRSGHLHHELEFRGLPNRPGAYFAEINGEFKMVRPLHNIRNSGQKFPERAAFNSVLQSDLQKLMGLDLVPEASLAWVDGVDNFGARIEGLAVVTDWPKSSRDALAYMERYAQEGVFAFEDAVSPEHFSETLGFHYLLANHSNHLSNVSFADGPAGAPGRIRARDPETLLNDPTPRYPSLTQPNKPGSKDGNLGLILPPIHTPAFIQGLQLLRDGNWEEPTSFKFLTRQQKLTLKFRMEVLLADKHIRFPAKKK